MTKKEAVTTIINVLKETMDALGENVETIKFNEDTRPVGDLKGFDSLAGIFATVSCLEQFNVDYDKQSLFVKQASNGSFYSLTIDQTADILVTISSKKINKKRQNNE